MRPRVLLADDHPELARGVSRFLSLSCDVVGCVVDAGTLLQAATELRPDVVLLDFSLPGITAFELCRRLRTSVPDIKVVLFTAQDDAELQRMAAEAGMSGFVRKMDAARDLVNTIHAVVRVRESQAP